MEGQDGWDGEGEEGGEGNGGMGGEGKEGYPLPNENPGYGRAPQTLQLDLRGLIRSGNGGAK